MFGKSRQAWYKRQKTIYKQAVEEHVILEMVRTVRKEMPRLGGRKLAKKLRDNHFKIGRDALFDLLRREGLLVRRRRTRIKTTQSHHWFRRYGNLIKTMSLTGPNQLWVSDITYVQTVEGHLYLFLITDAYSKKIVGYCLADNLKAENAVQALRMALKPLRGRTKDLVHHSDRGVQYCCEEYVKLLKHYEIRISMTEHGDPLENAIAERVNGILKDEWLYEIDPIDTQKAKSYIPQIINIYNTKRPHLSIEMLTPDQAHQKEGKLDKKWKNYYPKRRTHVYDELPS